ncbi:hypothetical protein [Geofilum rubicundum]|uniref:hypothetical protein n=1 Tax=Geofilum rubicundum TaxID=472113 RepID=UPI000780F94A|nr:hypothetical protein [Geofilum rubicundum]
MLVKRIDSDSKGHVDSNLLPENNSDFQLFVHEQPENSYVSIVRVEMLDRILDGFHGLGLNVAGVSAGPFSIGILSSLLEPEGRCLVGNWALEFNNHEIIEVKTLPEEEISNYDFEGECISSLLIGAYSLAVKYASGILGSEAVNENLNTGFAYRRLSFITVAFVFVLLFLSLFVNFLLFDKYSKDYELVTSDYLRSETLITELRSSEEELLKRKQIITRAGLEGNSQFAWYADRIASLMPSKIVLSRLAFQPAERRMQPGREVIFTRSSSILEGETTDILKVHEWIGYLKKEPWIVDVEIVSYNRAEDVKTGTFSLEIVFDER